MGKQIEKDQIFLTNLASRARFHYLRGKGHLCSYLWNRFQWHNYPRWHKVARFPLHVDVEISSICDMHCPMCYTSTELYKKRVNRTLMDLELFKKIIDECSRYGLFSIRLSLRGEAFVNRHLVEMLKYAKAKGIKEVSSLTNGLKLDEEAFRELIDAGLDWLTVSIDGWGKRYESIRIPAKFDDIYNKVKNYSLIKEKKKSAKPVIKIQSIWPAIQEDPAYFYRLFKPYADEVASNPLIDFLREDRDVQYVDDFCCVYPWQRMSIGADGHVLMCQCDDMEENILGDVRKDSIYDIWHGEKLNDVRRLHMERKGHLMLEPCRHCAYPRRKEFKEEASIDYRKVKVDKYTGRKDDINVVVGGKT